MYNLLMAGNDDAWDVDVGSDHEATFPLSRYLEYTEDEVERRLKPIEPGVVSFLSELPTVFMSELQTGPQKRQFVKIRVGRVWGIRIVGRDIVYQFRIDQNLGEVDVANRAVFEQLFDLGNWEISRTHWAVKSGYLGLLLRDAGLLQPAASDAELPPGAPPPQSPDLPEDEPALPIITNLIEFMQHVPS
ncbi:hypothetical protein U8P73_09805 [Rhizobium beringeri]|uniref:hypothetical protein n=1 Tax=Rhizobium beringeri TaxID=3019934 RepID=UPI002DDD38A2|nr:hypothetical protein [Rhizobium beringeri]WSG90723.1 hypothetical protein U8P73_09805 [Rhizobium beringeri]